MLVLAPESKRCLDKDTIVELSERKETWLDEVEVVPSREKNQKCFDEGVSEKFSARKGSSFDDVTDGLSERRERWLDEDEHILSAEGNHKCFVKDVNERILARKATCFDEEEAMLLQGKNKKYFDKDIRVEERGRSMDYCVTVLPPKRNEKCFNKEITVGLQTGDEACSTREGPFVSVDGNGEFFDKITPVALTERDENCLNEGLSSLTEQIYDHNYADSSTSKERKCFDQEINSAYMEILENLGMLRKQKRCRTCERKVHNRKNEVKQKKRPCHLRLLSSPGRIEHTHSEEKDRDGKGLKMGYCEETTNSTRNGKEEGMKKTTMRLEKKRIQVVLNNRNEINEQNGLGSSLREESSQCHFYEIKERNQTSEEFDNLPGNVSKLKQKQSITICADTDGQGHANRGSKTAGAGYDWSCKFVERQKQDIFLSGVQKLERSTHLHTNNDQLDWSDNGLDIFPRRCDSIENDLVKMEEDIKKDFALLVTLQKTQTESSKTAILSDHLKSALLEDKNNSKQCFESEVKDAIEKITENIREIGGCLHEIESTEENEISACVQSELQPPQQQQQSKPPPSPPQQVNQQNTGTSNLELETLRMNGDTIHVVKAEV